MRFLPGNNNAEVIFQGTGGVHNSLNVVAQKPFSVAENSLYDVTVIKSSSAGTETFELVVSGDSIVLDRSRVDNAAIEGGTWTRRSEI